MIDPRHDMLTHPRLLPHHNTAAATTTARISDVLGGRPRHAARGVGGERTGKVGTWMDELIHNVMMR